MENFDTEQFIEEIKNRPSLWDCTLDEYSNRDMKRQCWSEIVEIFCGKCLSATQRRYMAIALQKKWKGLRGCFTRELKRQDQIRSGEKSGPRKTEYTHFQQMLFLRKVVTCRTTYSQSFNDDNNETPTLKPSEIKIEELNDEYFEKSEEDEEEEVEDEATIESDANTDPLQEIEVCRQKRAKYDSLTEDEDKLFLLSMLRTLQSIPLKKKMATKIKLMTVLDEATRNLED